MYREKTNDVKVETGLPLLHQGGVCKHKEVLNN